MTNSVLNAIQTALNEIVDAFQALEAGGTRSFNQHSPRFRDVGIVVDDIRR